MKNLLLASTSALYGGDYLEYLQKEIGTLFGGVDEILFIPYARPSGISLDDYTQKVSDFFSGLQVKVSGLHTFTDPARAIREAGGYFTGGGNTFLLTKTLYDLDVPQVLKAEILTGKPYLGASAGTNLAGISIRTTNDMPIVYPASFDAMALVPFNINPHYLDPDPLLRHNGETRETRILEFLTQNETPVVGLREGSWLRCNGDRVFLEGEHPARIFEKGKLPYELTTGSKICFGG